MGKKQKVKDETKVERRRRRRERLDDRGRELGDSTPMAPALGYKREPTLAERIRNMVRSEHLRAAAEAAGAETFEEADDFNVEDDDTFDPSTPYEEIFEPPPMVPAAGGREGGGERGPPSAAPPARSQTDDNTGVQPPTQNLKKDGGGEKPGADNPGLKRE